jgi:cation transport regulator
MPYDNLSDLPDSVRNNLPKHAQEIYKEAFNSAEEQYGEESRAHRVAWSPVEIKYEKNDKGNWVRKKLTPPISGAWAGSRSRRT